MLRPLRNGVLLRASEAPQSSISGIILTNSISNQATVISVGPEVKELKVGDVVKYDEKSVAKVEGLLLCREFDVFCVVE